MYKKRIILLFNTSLMLLFVCGVQGQTFWVETTQEDFRDGTYERNLYSSHRGGGALESVPRFDLNNDGYIDLYVSNINVPYVIVYYGSPSGYSPSNRKLFTGVHPRVPILQTLRNSLFQDLREKAVSSRTSTKMVI
jgi:hypothetical protein